MKHNQIKRLEAQLSFITKAKNIHHNKPYDYSETEYINAKTKVKIKCDIHGYWYVIPRMHIRKINPSGCPHCAGNNQYSLTDFIEKCQEKHGLLYDYSNTEYINNAIKVKIYCTKCNRFFYQIARNHLHGQGCPYHKKSMGEQKIMEWLINNNYNFISQHTFNNCRGKKRPLPFDFYLPDLNTCIEFDGEQHYRPAFGIEKFKKLKSNDYIKNKFCKLNNINLIRIKYNDLNWINILNNLIT